MLHGHERSITQIKYNRDGDLLFSSAKDTHPCVWYLLQSDNTYCGLYYSLIAIKMITGMQSMESDLAHMKGIKVSYGPLMLTGKRNTSCPVLVIRC